METVSFLIDVLQGKYVYPGASVAGYITCPGVLSHYIVLL